MAIRALLQLNDASSRCLFTNIQFKRPNQIQNIFIKQNRYLRRAGRNDFEPSPRKKLWKSFAFAATFSATSFLGATIWEYERIRAQTYRAFGRLQPHRTVTAVGRWWSSLSDGQKIFFVICFLNTAVCLAWRVPAWENFMVQYFLSNPHSTSVCLPMILSVFSHHSFLHLAANMFVLHSFSTVAATYLGPEHFVAFYLSCGVLSSFTSNLYKTLLNRHNGSLGASGAIMGTLSFICMQFPHTNLKILLLPFTFQAGAAIKALLAFDTAGCVLGWQIFDHAAHLGGALCGIFWQQWGIEHIWRQRTPILTKWHEMRSGQK